MNILWNSPFKKREIDSPTDLNWAPKIIKHKVKHGIIHSILKYQISLSSKSKDRYVIVWPWESKKFFFRNIMRLKTKALKWLKRIRFFD